MDKKVRERRRAVNRERGRRRAGWVVVVVVLLIGLGAFLWLRSSDVFAVKRVTVTAFEHVTPQALSEATREARGVSLLRLRTGDIEDKLRELPYVRSVAVHRAFPDTLEVFLGEYEAVACVQAAEGGKWLVADDGRVLEKRLDERLPLIVPESRIEVALGRKLPPVVVGALPIVAVLADAEVDELLPEVEKVVVSPGGELTLRLAESIELRLGEPTELKQKLRAAGMIIQLYLRDGKPIEYVDARVPDRVAVNGE